jgi:type II secretory pathway pseudopilin PulG/cytoskeletal protein CcmA (bactofilin family)
MQKHKMAKNRQFGFSLLEILLAVGVLGAIIVGASTITQQWAGGQVTDNAARHMQQIRQAVQEYIRDDFENLPAGGALCNPNPPCNTIAELIAEGYLTAGFPARNPIGQDMTIAYREVNPPGGPIQAFIYPDPTANDPVDNIRVMEAVRAGGAGLGHIGEPAPADEAVGFGESWQIDPDPAPPAGFGITTPFNTANGSYLTGQVWVSREEFAGPYLLRNDIGNPDFNTMATDLNMGRNNILNAGEVTSERIVVNNLATIEGNLDVANDTDLNGNVSVEGNITVNEDFIASSATLNVEGGSVSPIGEIEVDTQADITGKLTANIAEVDNLTVNNEANINELTVTDTVDANTITVNDAMVADRINADFLNVSNINGGSDGTLPDPDPINNIIVQDVEVQGVLDVTGTAYIADGEFEDVSIDTYTCNGGSC